MSEKTADLTAEISWFRLHLALLKPRILLLLEMTALCGVLVHDLLHPPGGERPWLTTMRTLVLVGVGGFLAAGGANALNMWYERDIDARMERTRSRPLPQGLLPPRHVLYFGLLTAVAGVALLGLAAAPLAGLAAAASVLIYVGLYTFYLKRRTPHNIVIGGAAGALPPLIGWLAAGGSPLDPLPWLMFALVFLWTPPHFWSLALFVGQDYKTVGLPMLPVVRGQRVTGQQITAYSVALLGLTPGFILFGSLGLLFLVVGLALGANFLRLALAINRSGNGAPRRLFFYSLAYLFSLFLLMVIDSALSGPLTS